MDKQITVVKTVHPVFAEILERHFRSVPNSVTVKKCPSYGCLNVLGPDAGIIDGDRYCADCVAAEAHEAGRAERLENAELFARGIF